MLPRSIRWRLPLSYALIALVTTLALGGVLLTTLRDYYDARERAYLTGNAESISQGIRQMYRDGLSTQAVNAALGNYAFIARARVRLLDANQRIIGDSGSFGQDNIITFSFAEQAVPSAGAIFVEQAPVDTVMLTAPAPPQTIEVRPAPLTTPAAPGEMFTMPANYAVTVFGSPFGYRLFGDEMEMGRVSDQQVSIPLHDERQNVLGYIELSESPAYGTDILNSVKRALLLASVTAVLLAAAVGWVMSQNISAPVLALTKATEQMAVGQLSARVKLKRQDELGRLAHTFNDMAQRVEQTVLTLRRFVADAAHELHTPLTALNTNLELALTEKTAAQQIAYIQRAQGQLKRLESLTNGLLDLARLETETPRESNLLDLVPLLRQMSEVYASRAEQAGLALHLDVPEQPILVQGHEAQLARVVDNLLDNALKFTPEDGAIHLGVTQQAAQVQVWVRDTGIGIPAEDMPQLFNRFHRGRNAAAYPGNGLGLAIIKTIVEGHGGQITLESDRQGTRFLIQLPQGATA